MVHFAKKTRRAWQSFKYLGLYLKRPSVLVVQARWSITNSKEKNKRLTLSQEIMTGRSIVSFPVIRTIHF